MAKKTPARAPERPPERPPEIVTVGRVVHYREGNNDLPGIIVATGEGGIEDSCELIIFTCRHVAGEVCQRRSYVPFDPTGKVPHSWHWPERDNGLKGMQIDYSQQPAAEPFPAFLAGTIILPEDPRK